MSGTFSSFGTALSALHHSRVLMDVASSNIANSGTAGYVRRRAEGETVGSVGQSAMYARSDPFAGGEGVTTAALSRVNDQFLDARARHEHGDNSYLRLTVQALSRFESSIGEPGTSGVSAALDEFRAGWHDLANSPNGSAARQQVLDRASTLSETIRIQAANVSQEEADQRNRVDVLLAEANTVASDLASTNRAVAVAGFDGTDANLLLDQRDQLAMRLAELTGGVASLRPDGGFDVTVGGVSLVRGAEADTLSADTAAPAGQVVLGVTRGGVTSTVSGARGEIGAGLDLVNNTLPGYREELAGVVRELVTTLNAQHAAGFDQDGLAGAELFVFDAADPAGTLSVALTDTRRLAASGLPGGGLDGSNATALAATGPVEERYQQLVNGLGSMVASLDRLATNQQALTNQVDNSRDQLSGVSTDEELVAMVSAQRSYEAASRVLTTLDQMLDTLINSTGVVGR